MPEPPRTARQLAAAAAHQLLADLVTAGLDLPSPIGAIALGSDCEVWVSIAPLRPAPADARPAADVQTPAPLTTPVGRASVLPSGPPARAYSDMEAAILDVLGHLPAGQVLTGPEIAEHTIYPYETPLRTCLAALRRRGLIRNHAPGYSLPSAAASSSGS